MESFDDSLQPLEPMEGASKGGPPEEEYQPSRLRMIGIIVFAVTMFFIFLVFKLPEARIQNLVIAHARIIAQEQGFLFNAEKVQIGMLLGPSLKMQNVELKSIDNEKQVLKIPYLRVRPRLLSLFSSTKKMGVVAELLDGEISGVLGAGPTGLYVDLDLDKIDVGATTLLKKFALVEIGGKINGRIYLDFNQEQVQKSEGKIVLKIDKLALPKQSLYGFNLPTVNVKETNIEISIAQGQLVIRNFEVGKDIKSDDIVAKVTGDGTLDRSFDRSRLNAKAVFQLSQGVIQSFPILDALLEPAKASDGKYSYRITGPLTALEPVPGG